MGLIMAEIIDLILRTLGLQPAPPISDPEPQIGPVIIHEG